MTTRAGNWKGRLICSWWGHDNIGTWHLLTGERVIMCLRCRAEAVMDRGDIRYAWRVDKL